jgi:anti-anti-sigma factor
MSLEVTISEVGPQGGVAVLAPHGELDSQTVQHLEESLDLLLHTHAHAIVDLSQTRYVSSAGWRAFVRRASLGADQRLKITGMNVAVREVFDLLGLAHVLEVFPSVAAAMESLPAAVRQT